MKEYRVVVASDLGEFEYWVNEMLREGWQLVGGVAVVHEPNEPTHLVQAFVREKDEDGIQ